MKELTFKQYRQIDLTFLCILTAIFEAVATLASNTWFSLQAMTISITLTLTCIAIIRWGALGIITTLTGSVVYCLLSSATTKHYIIYCVGSLFCLVVIPLLNLLKKERVKKDFVYRLMFVGATYFSIAIGRWLCSLPFTFSFGTILAFIFSDILSLLFAIVVLSIAKNADGLLEDQKSYLLRLENERIEKEESNNFTSF